MLISGSLLNASRSIYFSWNTTLTAWLATDGIGLAMCDNSDKTHSHATGATLNQVVDGYPSKCGSNTTANAVRANWDSTASKERNTQPPYWSCWGTRKKIDTAKKHMWVWTQANAIRWLSRHRARCCEARETHPPRVHAKNPLSGVERDRLIHYSHARLSCPEPWCTERGSNLRIWKIFCERSGAEHLHCVTVS